MPSKRSLSPFNLSFLDIMFCGFGAVVLLVMLLNGDMVASRNKQVANLRQEVNRLKSKVNEGKKNLVELRAGQAETDSKIAVASSRIREVSEIIRQTRKELSGIQSHSLAGRQHINKLQADLKNLEAENIRLRQQKQQALSQGAQARKFIGQGDRQYLTGLRLGGRRILLLVDTSASMLDETIVNIILRRNLDKNIQQKAPKWQRVLRTVDWLLANLPAESQVRIVSFNTAAGSISSKWVKIKDNAGVNRMRDELRRRIPHGGTSLYQAFATVRAISPRPDNILLLTDGLPTYGREKPAGTTVSGQDRLKYFKSARAVLPGSIPVNTILFPLEGDPLAAAAFWQLAVESGGSFLTPAGDWP